MDHPAWPAARSTFDIFPHAWGIPASIAYIVSKPVTPPPQTEKPESASAKSDRVWREFLKTGE